MLDRKTVEKLIRESVERSKRGRREFHLFHRTMVSVKQDVLPNIDFHEIIGFIERIMPPHLFEEVDDIFVGSFDENDDRALEAHYEDGAIYITSDLPANTDYVENIVHETAHSLESARGLEIYGDRRAEEEFLGKRRRLAATMQNNGIKISHLDFESPEYVPEFDSFLYKEIGYGNLSSMTMGLFVSPYGATSLQEYFANGFEEFFLGDRGYLKRVSPQLFIKIMEIINNEI